MTSLPDNTVYVPLNGRSTNHYYIMQPMETMIFEFMVQPLGSTVIQATHHYTNAQDWSITAWFSSVPLDGVLFLSRADYDFPRLNRYTRTFTFFDNALTNLAPGSLVLPVGTIFYANIRNSQNELNAFKLTFNY